MDKNCGFIALKNKKNMTNDTENQSNYKTFKKNIFAPSFIILLQLEIY